MKMSSGTGVPPVSHAQDARDTSAIFSPLTEDSAMPSALKSVENQVNECGGPRGMERRHNPARDFTD